ncbi:MULTISPECIES: hypothetical protein [Oceanithermus]|uniref:Uncharacterized protein n=2 Tax=Oceanithermus desulfurans TaxID=227924 RepID=A0A511RJ87_9DEIN|nr:MULTISPECIES: hypothetical protein [Oceanithermus]MBB6029597.1 hypothetical protein [Oceanithermus desulfurans]GEM89708.1 hypothetical protein ODE01S_11420 [Oceanithermus desulfurans NBRC 100063]
MNLERPHNDEELQIWRLYAPLETRAGILFVEWRWEPRRYRLGGAEGVVLKTAGVERLIQALARNEPWAPGPITWNPPVLLIGDQAYHLGKRGHLILARVLNQMLREIEPLP